MVVPRGAWMDENVGLLTRSEGVKLMPRSGNNNTSSAQAAMVTNDLIGFEGVDMVDHC